MKDLNYISHEITKNKNLELNLPKYITGMDSLYYTLGYVKMSMNFYTLFDMIHENPSTNENLSVLFDRFCDVIKEYFLEDNNCKWDRAESELESIRNEIISTMEAVTAYVDMLRIHEYVLNRIEHRFLDTEVDYNYYGTYLTNDIIHYIFEERDNVVINSKISEVVGQLPMRLSSSKFYDYLRDSFTVYHGAQKATIDDFVYAIRTSAGINSYEVYAEQFPVMNDIIKTLNNADYGKMDKAEYDRLSSALKIGTDKMNDCADMYVLFAQMVNDAYSVALCGSNAITDSIEVTSAKDILKEIIDAKESNVDELLIYDKFSVFEGCQERAMSVISKSDFAVDYVLNGNKDIMNQYNVENDFRNLSKVAKLQSGSDFVKLDEETAVNDIPDDSYADEVCNELIEQFKLLFENTKTQVKRAIMSTVLSQLPVFFNNVNEIQSYINISLEQCNDKAEQNAVIEIMKQIMNL